MYKYLFEFQNGSTILIPAMNKMKAIEMLFEKYYKLFETENFKVTRIGLELTEIGEIKTEFE